MNASEQEIDVLSRRRVRLGVWIAASFVMVLASIAANDALVQAGKATSLMRTAALACLAAGGVMLVVSLLRIATLLRRSMVDPGLRRKLWDELATANHSHSMVFAYLAMLLLVVALTVISMFINLSAPWVLNGLLVAAFGVQSISFALLERRGASRDA